MVYLLFENGLIGALGLEGFQPASEEQSNLVQISLEDSCDDAFAQSAQRAVSLAGRSVIHLSQLSLPLQLHATIQLNEQRNQYFRGQSASTGFAIASMEYFLQEDFGCVYVTGIMDYAGAIHVVQGFDSKIQAVIQQQRLSRNGKALFVYPTDQLVQDGDLKALQDLGVETCAVSQFNDLIRYLLGSEAVVNETLSPYRGLQVFGYRDHWLYFGREKDKAALFDLTTQAVDAVRGASQTTVPMILLEGKVGSGKSSLVNAGLLPMLARRNALTGIDQLCWSQLRPGGDKRSPIDNLIHALMRINVASSQTHSTEIEVGAQPPAVADELRTLVRSYFESETPKSVAPELMARLQKWLESRCGWEDNHAGRRACYVMFVDQFEEIFVNDEVTPECRQRYFQLLRLLASSRQHALVIVLGMRSDFHDRLVDYPELHNVFSPQGSGLRYELAAPTEENYMEIITRPAQLVGLRFETVEGINLAEVLRHDVLNVPNGLALLQFTLDELTRLAQADGELSLQTYRKMGGLTGILTSRAEQVYLQLSRQAQQAIETVFAFLVGLDLRTNQVYARRVAEAHAGFSSLQREVIDSLVSAQLLDRDEQSVENTEDAISYIRFSHETLLYSWSRVQDWIKKEKNRLILLASIESDLQQWLAHRASTRNKEFLLPAGERLDQARQLTREDGAVSSELKEFVNASWRAARVRQNVLIATSVTFALTAMVAIVFSVISSIQQEKLLLRAVQSTAQNMLDKDPTKTYLLAAKLHARQATLASERLLWRAANNPFYYAKQQHENKIQITQLSPEHNLLLTITRNNLITLFNGEERRVVARYQHNNKIKIARIAAAVNSIFFADGNGRLYAWDYSRNKLTAVLPGIKDNIVDLHVAPGASRIVVELFDKSLLVDAKRHTMVKQLQVAYQPVKQAGKTAKPWKMQRFVNRTELLLTLHDSTVRLLDVDSGKLHTPFAGPILNWYLESESLLWLIPKDVREPVLVWDTRRRKLRYQIKGGVVRQEGIRIVSAYAPTAVFVTYTNTSEEKHDLIRFSRGSASDVYEKDKTTSFKNVVTGHIVKSYSHTRVQPLLAIAGLTNPAVNLYNIDDPQKPTAVLKGHKDFVFHLRAGSRGRYLYTIGNDHTVYLWDKYGLARPLNALGVDSRVLAYRFKDNQHYVLTQTGNRLTLFSGVRLQELRRVVVYEFSRQQEVALQAMITPSLGHVLVLTGSKELLVIDLKSNSRTLHKDDKGSGFRRFRYLTDDRVLLQTRKSKLRLLELNRAHLSVISNTPVRRVLKAGKYTVLVSAQGNQFSIWNNSLSNKVLVKDVVGSIRNTASDPQRSLFIYSYLQSGPAGGSLHLVVYDVAKNKIIYQSNASEFVSINSLALSPDRNYLAVAGNDKIDFYNLTSMRKTSMTSDATVKRVWFTPDSNHVIALTRDGESQRAQTLRLHYVARDAGRINSPFSYVLNEKFVLSFSANQLLLNVGNAGRIERWLIRPDSIARISNFNMPGVDGETVTHMRLTTVRSQLSQLILQACFRHSTPAGLECRYLPASTKTLLDATRVRRRRMYELSSQELFRLGL